MSKNYDNWERLVEAVLRREKDRWLARQDSLSSCSTSAYSSSFISISRLNLGTSFSNREIAQATRYFSDEDLIKRGHSGDLFKGSFRHPQIIGPAVVKRIDFSEKQSREESLILELEFFSKMDGSNRYSTRFIPLLGHNLDDDGGGGDPNVKFLIYPYLQNRDLSYSLFVKPCEDNPNPHPSSLHWITRWKIASGVAEALSYLQHGCNPPLVHGDIQASSILLDHNFEVRLGSLSHIRPDRKPTGFVDRILHIFDFSTECANDVYCFGKVLLELITGKLGISDSKENDATMLEFVAQTLCRISIDDKSFIQEIMDPSLTVRADLLEDVWAMAIVAKSCLNPDPIKRPQARDILRALENPPSRGGQNSIWYRYPPFGNLRPERDPKIPRPRQYPEFSRWRRDSEIPRPREYPEFFRLRRNSEISRPPEFSRSRQDLEISRPPEFSRSRQDSEIPRPRQYPEFSRSPEILIPIRDHILNNTYQNSTRHPEILTRHPEILKSDRDHMLNHIYHSRR